MVLINILPLTGPDRLSRFLMMINVSGNFAMNVGSVRMTVAFGELLHGNGCSSLWFGRGQM